MITLLGLCILVLLLVPIFFVLAIWGLIRKERKLKLIGGVGCVASMLLSVSGMVFIFSNIDKLKTEMQEQYQRDMEFMMKRYKPDN